MMGIEVYHGATDVIEHPICRFGRNYLDFGSGFYVTDFREQAVKWAMRVGNNREKVPMLNVFRLDKEGILREGRCKFFTAYDREWLRFIVANRMGENLAAQYDYIEGGVADDRVINTINLYMQGYTDEEFALKRLAEHRPNNQICLLNQQLTDKYLIYDHTEQL